uniref:Uncharacterized protein n=1 Tax=Arundo donax TaxID=35708 RepID=A0A0A9B3X2_ARUDO
MEFYSSTKHNVTRSVPTYCTHAFPILTV